ncbi:hypothetical protein Sango_0806000 [Sesamum angolense]|uniref:Uncharacterized protein n=1 Tax=Sesamum angolense TaxID=2727404 RepID=A0AAE2C0B9_9LAMI|nr:hypothetical protein Sango_0806000 [Sesamum angolense]
MTPSVVLVVHDYGLSSGYFGPLSFVLDCLAPWAIGVDAEIHLDANGLENNIKQGNKASNQDKAKAIIFLRRHLHEGLKIEYLMIKDPFVLWNNLKKRYDHQKTVILPKARYDWMHLRLQEFKTQQYREKGFTKYSELISCLLVAEQNNELLLKNHESRPTGSAPFPKVNVATRNHYNHESYRGRGHNHSHGRGHERGYRGVILRIYLSTRSEKW